MMFTNLFGCFLLVPSSFFTGELVPALDFMIETPKTAVYLSVLAVTTYTGVSAYMRLISNYSGVTAAVVTTSRKVVTIVLSFVFFPKGANWGHVMSGAVVLLGVVFNDVARRAERQQMKACMKSTLEHH
mmetsp:Transcript_2234/g.5285  ORF Transcript_2234/g.5285 Transcript_2234/m.5285 type:complete len:129 (+) Transcript_2234:992-1378(+)